MAALALVHRYLKAPNRFPESCCDKLMIREYDYRKYTRGYASFQEVWKSVSLNKHKNIRNALRLPTIIVSWIVFRIQSILFVILFKWALQRCLHLNQLALGHTERSTGLKICIKLYAQAFANRPNNLYDENPHYKCVNCKQFLLYGPNLLSDF